MSKHTSGPWRIAAKNKSNCYYVIHGKDDSPGANREIQVVTINYGTHPIKEHLDMVEANAKLIAAAPLLLHELQECHKTIQSLEHAVFTRADQALIDERIKSIKHAIKQATGE